jgi:hypothetical protein
VKRFLLLYLTLCCFLHAPSIKAQELQRFKAVLVEIWPEFDQPNVLVIFHIQLPDDVILPVQIPLLIPNSADLSAVAYKDPGGELLYADYSSRDLDEWTQLLINTQSAIIQIEYYLPLSKTGDLRQIEFTWIPSGPVDEFSLIFQNPARSSGVQLDPESISTQLGRYNLMYSSIQPLSLEAAQTFQFYATYEKPDDELSIASPPVDAEIPLENSVEKAGWNTVLPWVLGGIGLFFIVFGMLALFGFKRKAIRKSRSSKSIHNTKTTKEKLQTGVFCHECGRRAEEGDQFCRSCGVKLRANNDD